MSATTKKRAVIIMSVFAACVLTMILVFVFRSKGDIYDYSHLIKPIVCEDAAEFKPIDNIKENAMVTAAKSERLKLCIDPETAVIAVKDLQNNQMWYSNPKDLQSDKLANTEEKSRLANQATVYFFDSLQRENSFSTYIDSVAKNQFEIESIQDGVRVIYSMGDFTLGAEQLPKYITLERLEEKILSKVTQEQREYFEKRYVESSKKGYLEIMSKYLTSEIILNKLLEILDTAGYTPEDLATDNQTSGYVASVHRPYIKLPIDYKIKDDNLTVNVDMSSVEFEPSMWLSGIELMNFFGAGSLQDEGYMLVPSGCGGIIHFNNGKQNEEIYSQAIYGVDSVALPKSEMQSVQSARLPVYGIKNGEGAFIASIENGAAISSVYADVSRRKNSYNFVYPRFALRSYDKINMNGISGQATDMKLIEKTPYDGEITIKYSFLTQEDANYSGMARYYRNHLESTGLIKQNELGGQEAPFYLDLLGAVQKRKIALGVPYNTLMPLTTFDEANFILDELQSGGINNVQMTYKGWFNRGVNHDVAKSVSMSKQVGSKKELTALDERLKGQDGQLFPDTAFQLVAANTKHYSSAKEAARVLEGKTAMFAPYNPATLFMNAEFDNDAFYVNAITALPMQVDSFLNSYSDVEIRGLSLRDLGDVLSSDKRKKNSTTRESASYIAAEQLEKIAEKHDILISGGNQYALAEASRLTNVPVRIDPFYIIDEEVPFYQMVVSGKIEYAGAPMNLSENFNKENEILKMMEYGYAPHFLWTYANMQELADTAYADYYSTHYADWIEAASEIYGHYSVLYEKTSQATMTEHNNYSNGLSQTVYDNGVNVYINHTSNDLSHNGFVIHSKQYYIDD